MWKEVRDYMQLCEVFYRRNILDVMFVVWK